MRVCSPEIREECAMNIIVVLIILLLLFGGGGFTWVARLSVVVLAG